jgi:hypothetical protein
MSSSLSATHAVLRHPPQQGGPPSPQRPSEQDKTLGAECTGTWFTFWTGHMVYNPLAVKVALVEGLRLGQPVLREISVVAEAVGMWKS